MADHKAGFVQRVKDAANYLWNGQTMEYTPLFATGPGFFYGGSGINWDINYWKDGYYDNEIVYQALRVYLRKAKVAPILVSRVIDEKQLVKYEQFVLSAKNQEHRVIALKHRQKALEELEDHSLLTLFGKPNSYQTRSELIESLLGYWKLAGDGYLYGGGAPEIGVNAGKFTELHVLESHLCSPVYSGNWRDPISHYEYNIDGETLRIDKRYICHLKDWNPGDKKRGLSPTIPGKKVIKTDSYNKTAQARAFENGGSATLLSSDSEQEDYQWTKEQAELVDKKIQQKLSGAHNYGNIFSVTRPVKAQSIGDSVAEMKLIDAAKYSRPVISNLFGVDGVLIGDKEGGTENNVESAYKSLVTNTIVPDLIELREHLSQWLLPSYGGQKLHIDFDTSVYPELQPDLKLLMEVYGKPIISVDENRNQFNFDSLDNKALGEALLVQSGYDTLENIVIGASDNAAIDSQIEEALKYGDYR